MLLSTRTERRYLENRYPYVRVGEGPHPLVFVPGIDDAMFTGKYGPVAARGITMMFRRFLDDYTVYVVSRQRGLDEGASIADMADDYAEVIESNVGSASVLGISMGGLIAQDLAYDYPDLVDRLVVGVAGCRLSSRGEEITRELRPLSLTQDWTEIRSRMLGEMYTGVRNLAYPRLSNTIGRLRPPIPAMPRDVTVSMDAVLEFDATDRLDGIEPPTLVAGGTEDPFFPEPILRETASGIPNAALATFPGARHGAFRERKETFDHLAKQFLAGEPISEAVAEA